MENEFYYWLQFHWHVYCLVFSFTKEFVIEWTTKTLEFCTECFGNYDYIKYVIKALEKKPDWEWNLEFVYLSFICLFFSLTYFEISSQDLPKPRVESVSVLVGLFSLSSYTADWYFLKFKFHWDTTFNIWWCNFYIK